MRFACPALAAATPRSTIIATITAWFWSDRVNTENHVVPPDGRKLAYTEFGKLEGEPVLHFHGAPSSSD